MDKKKFDLFRYQLLPTSIDNEYQLSIFDKTINSRSELIENKNRIFAKVFQTFEDDGVNLIPPKEPPYRIVQLIHPKRSTTEIIFRFIHFSDHYMMGKLGINRAIPIHTKDFEVRRIDNWPNVRVLCNNLPNRQIIAIENNPQVFYRTTTVANIIEYNINKRLKDYQLQVKVNPIFSSYDFWAIVNKYQQSITQVSFTMVTPNLSDISQNLELDLKAINRDTNTQITKMELNSSDDDHLTISPNSSFIKSLVDYSSAGGGTINLKAKGVRRKITTQDSITEINIDEVELSGSEQEIFRLISQINQNEEA
jgi:hypothetical protein